MSEVRTPTRRLIDLHPQWLGGGDDELDRIGLHLELDCPCCDAACPAGGRVSIPIQNPVDGGAPTRHLPPLAGWSRTGMTFDALTLAPSILVRDHWHGWIRDGKVVSV